MGGSIYYKVRRPNAGVGTRLERLNMATIRITDLKLRVIIGVEDWERKAKQDVIINIKFDFDAGKACVNDNIQDTLDYKTLTKRIIKEAEGSSFFLLEKFAQRILDTVLDYPLVKKASVRVDKPFALRFADSVSIELRGRRGARGGSI
jgi:FolB domain-containing protein